MKPDMHEDKTEQPTARHIEKFKKQGKTRYSRELNSLLVLIVGMLSIWFLKNIIFNTFYKIMFKSFYFNKNIMLLNGKNILLFFSIHFKEVLIIFLPFFSLLIFVVLVSSILFSGIHFTLKSLKINFKKLNPLNGFKKMFSIQVFIDFIKITSKLFIITSIVLWYSWIYFFKIFLLNTTNATSSLLYGFNIIAFCCFFVILGLTPIVFIDIFWKQWTHYKNLKMTRQEIKEEFKEQEGNPHVKMRIRQIMKLNARRRMISDVSKSDVVIINPIHYSIALKYDVKKMQAPKVMAKGIGLVAQKIKDTAIKNNIPVIASPSLARLLYRYSEINHYIPGPLYKAVAEILAWVWRVKKWKQEGGIFPEKPNILVPSESSFTGETKNNV